VPDIEAEFFKQVEEKATEEVLLEDDDTPTFKLDSDIIVKEADADSPLSPLLSKQLLKNLKLKRQLSNEEDE
jgi:spore coat polysaccharide biosynthesis predicted glycosyltransferase SpsG